jgi:hypothetical protein
MDPIEIFELTGYVVQAPANNAELAVYTTEIRPYVVQRARSADAVFASEIRAYMVQTGQPKSGVAVNTTTAYIIVRRGNDTADIHRGTDASRTRKPGTNVRKSTMIAVVGSDNAQGIHNRTPAGRPTLYGGAGLAVVNSTMYTIEVP